MLELIHQGWKAKVVSFNSPQIIYNAGLLELPEILDALRFP